MRSDTIRAFVLVVATLALLDLYEKLVVADTGPLPPTPRPGEWFMLTGALEANPTPDLWRFAQTTAHRARTAGPPKKAQP